jgi:catecholate siderophore receptor
MREIMFMLLATSALHSASHLAFAVLSCRPANAEEPSPIGQAAAVQSLPPVNIDAPTPRVQRRRVDMRHQENTIARRIVRRSVPRLVRRLAPHLAAAPAGAPPGPAVPAETQDARTGTLGVYSNSTAVATKTNTALVNIPQSVSVLTKSFIQDQSPQNSPTSRAMFPASRSIRARATATSLSSAASIPARTSSSTVFATTCKSSAISTTCKASKS